MLFRSNRVRDLVPTQPIDFRKGHDGWLRWCHPCYTRIRSRARSFCVPLAQADRLKLLYWDGTGLVLAYKRLEDATFTCSAIKDGVMTLNHAQSEAPFARLAWRRGRHAPGSGIVHQRLVCRLLLEFCNSSGLCRPPPPLIFPSSRPRNARRYWR